jgi:hypothetical protein
MTKADQTRPELMKLLRQKPNFMIRWGLTVLAVIALLGYVFIRFFYDIS